MALPILLASIAIATILFTLPGFAPYVHELYPAYGYYIWQYAPSILRHILLVDALALRINRIADAYHSVRQALAPRFLLYAALTSLVWILQTIVTRSGLFAPFWAGLNVLAGCWDKVVGFNSSLRERTVELLSRPLGHIDRLLVKPCSRFTLSFWPCALSHAMSCAVVSGFDVTTPSSIRAMVSSYPLSWFVGVLTLIVLWRLVSKMIVLGGLGIDALAYVYLVTISRIARALSPLRLVYWVVFLLSVKHVFDMNDLLDQVARWDQLFPILPLDRSLELLDRLANYTILAFIIREDVLVQQVRDLGVFLRKALPRYAFMLVRLAIYVCTAALWLVTRLVFKRILVPAVQRIVFNILCWTCMVCSTGCIVAASAAVELFVALLAPVYYEYSTGDLKSPPLPFQSRDPCSVLEVLSAPPSPSNSSHSTASEGVRRLGRLINVYLDESASRESVVELEGQFENTPSMHAPPPSQIISPPTHFPIPATPDLLSDLNFEYANEDKDILALAARLSSLHIKPESSLARKESRRAPYRSTITFAVFSPSPRPELMTPLRD
ncbi:hypothetical protein RhiJN_15146 [Ceratobasidium sp. AG-Ba]|nr:hypothetical protein RhiJN_15146 [Ceratobasidium sp. AG-Ba]